MICISMAGLRIGIDNQYPLERLLAGWESQDPPDFTVRATEAELDREDRGRGLSRSYLESICVYRRIAEELPDWGAFVIHGAAVARQGRAYLFTAPSGTGKTTHIRQWLARFPDAWVLNGDKPVLREGPEGFLVCGTPWRGKERLGCPGELPLQGICLLGRGAENRIRPAGVQELVNFLMKQTYPPKVPRHMLRFLELLDRCCRSVPVWAMDCTISQEAAELAWETMKPSYTELP